MSNDLIYILTYAQHITLCCMSMRCITCRYIAWHCITLNYEHETGFTNSASQLSGAHLLECGQGAFREGAPGPQDAPGPHPRLHRSQPMNISSIQGEFPSSAAMLKAEGAQPSSCSPGAACCFCLFPRERRVTGAFWVGPIWEEVKKVPVPPRILELATPRRQRNLCRANNKRRLQAFCAGPGDLFSLNPQERRAILRTPEKQIRAKHPVVRWHLL